MRPYLVVSPLIFGRIGVRKSVRTPSMMAVAPTMKSHTLVGINDRFVPWDNLSNLLNS